MARSAGMKQKARGPNAWLELVAEGTLIQSGREEAAAAAEAKEVNK